MSKRTRPLNTKIVAFNLADANTEIARLAGKAVLGSLREEELQIGLRHAYHHLNFAWNIRRTPTAEYASLSQEQFEQWGKYPTDIDDD